jgi:signal transduction histidine kinase
LRKWWFKLNVFVLVLLSIQMSAQTSVDSLKHLLSTQSIKDRIPNLITLSQQNVYLDSKQAKLYAEEALFLAKQIGDEKSQASAYYYLGFSKYRLGDYSAGLSDLFKTMEINTRIKDYTSLAITRNLIAIINFYIGRYEISTKLYSQNLVYYKSVNNMKYYCKMLINLATVFSQKGNYDKALENLHEAEEYAKKNASEDAYFVGYIICNIGEAYFGKKEYNLALKNYFESLEYLKKINLVDGIANLQMDIGLAYLEMKNFGQAINYFNLARKNYIDIKYIKGVMDVNENIIRYYKAVEQPNKALEEAQSLETMCIDCKDTVMLAKCYNYFAEIYDAKHDYAVSSKYYKKYFALKNIIEENEDKQNVVALQLLTDAEETDMENVTLKHDNELQKERLKNSRLIFISVIVGLVLLSVFLFVLYKEEKNIRKYAALLEKKNEEINIQNNKLEEVIQAKDKFFSIIAHDLRSPFTGLLGLTEVINENVDELTSAELSTVIEQLHLNVKNLFDLLKNLLDWAQMQQDNIQCNRIEIGLLKIVESNMNLIASLANQKEITINCNIPANQTVLADEAMLNSILSNLLSNSIKFTRHGGMVTVSSKTIDANLLEVSIADTGIGMSESMVNKLFKISEKVGRYGTEGEKSTGLGLILCKELVEKNGGTIRVESQENVGSTFYFTLSLAETK